MARLTASLTAAPVLGLLLSALAGLVGQLPLVPDLLDRFFLVGLLSSVALPLAYAPGLRLSLLAAAFQLVHLVVLASLASSLAMAGSEGQWAFIWVSGPVQEWLGVLGPFGFDALSAAMVLLSFTLISASVAYVLSDQFLAPGDRRPLVLILLSMEQILLVLFTTASLISFYIFFELSLVPLYFLVVIWGSRPRRTFAGYQFYLYTASSSFALLLGLLQLILWLGSQLVVPSQNSPGLPAEVQCAFFLLLSLAFLAKLPAFPLHPWLLEAHVEAPTVGSVVLAGLMLKLGGYGLVRFCVPLFPFGAFYFFPGLAFLGILGSLLAVLFLLRQTDLKRMVAYSSVVHMNFLVPALVSSSGLAVLGAAFTLVSHGLISAALFFLVGFLYQRTGTRGVLAYGGLLHLLPRAGGFLIILALANISVPVFSSFAGELLTGLGLAELSLVYGLSFLAVATILGPISSLWSLDRIVRGPLSSLGPWLLEDLVGCERLILALLLGLSLALGLGPQGLAGPLGSLYA